MDYELVILNRIDEVLREEESRITAILLNGSVKDYAEYKYQVGCYHGLRTAWKAMDLIVEKLKN